MQNLKKSKKDVEGCSTIRGGFSCSAEEKEIQSADLEPFIKKNVLHLQGYSVTFVTMKKKSKKARN